MKREFIVCLISLLFAGIFLLYHVTFDNNNLKTDSKNKYRISGKIEFPDSSKIGDSVCITALSEQANVCGGTKVFFRGSSTETYQITDLPKSDDYVVFAWSDTFQTKLFNNADSMASAKKINTDDEKSVNNIDFVLNEGSSFSENMVSAYQTQ
jgi:hypothetical protein